MCEGAPPFEGINRLHAGFSLWCDAIEETAPAARSQRILAGSLQLGAHEQHHLQGAIAGSMDMGINQSAALYRKRLVSESGAIARLEPSIASALDPVVRATGDLWGDLMTKLLGTIETPDGTLLLDHDVPPIPGQPFTPPEIEPVVVDDLATLLARFDRSDGNGVGSAAADWVNLDDRMNFIANLFVSRHHRSELFQAPFNGAVVSDIEAGRIPGQTFSICWPSSRAAAPSTAHDRNPTVHRRVPRGPPNSIRLAGRQGRQHLLRRERGGTCPALCATGTSLGRRRPGRAAARRRRIRHRQGALAGVGRSRTGPKKARSSSASGGPNSAWRCGWRPCRPTMPARKERSRWPGLLG